MSGNGRYVSVSSMRSSGREGRSDLEDTVEAQQPLLVDDPLASAPPTDELQTSGASKKGRLHDANVQSPIPRYPQPGSALQSSSSLFPPRTLRPSRSPSPLHASHPPLPDFILNSGLSPATLSFIERNTGLLLVASSQIFFVFMGLTAKFFVSTTSISTLTLILVRMSITAMGSLLWLFVAGNPNPLLGPPEPGVRRLLMWRGFFGFGGLFANYQSLRGLSLSDSVTIQFLAPNLTALLGFLVLGETLGWREVAAGVSCLGGVVLVSRPPLLFGSPVDSLGTTGPGNGGLTIPEEGVDAGITHADRMVAVGWAFASLCSATCAYITIRKIGKKAHAMHSMLYFCYSCIIACSVGLVLHIRSFVFLQTWKEFWLIILIGVFGFVAQMLLTFGLQREKAGRAALAMYLSLLYSLFFELVLFGTIPPLLSLLGGAIIITSAVWVAVTKPADKPAASKQADEESLPLSRSPSPIPYDGQARRGESYSYASDAGPEARGAYTANGAYDHTIADKSETEVHQELGKQGGLRPTTIWSQEDETGGRPGRLLRRRSGESIQGVSEPDNGH